MKAKRERIFALDFVRCVCALIIVFFHYACHTASEHNFFFTNASSDYGGMVVTAFFILSGAALFYTYPKIDSLRMFYFKRWKSIFPMFYLCFIFYYIQTVFETHKVFYGPSPKTLILSLFGVDGYFSYRIPNYYHIGEWFLGAIVLLYLLYPFIIMIMKKCRFIIPIVLLIGYYFVLNGDYFIINKIQNLITCMTSFIVGIMFMEHKNIFFENKRFMFAISIIAVVLFFVPIPILHRLGISVQVHGVFVFLLLVFIGGWIKNYRVNVVVLWISKLSFPIFLFQHKVILNLLGVYNPTDIKGEIIMIMVALILTLICSMVLNVVNDALLKSKGFVALENVIRNDY